MKKREFWRVAVKDFLKVGAVVPSSRWIEERVLKRLPEAPTTIVEYGCGTGRITHGLLASLSSKGKLIGLELNEEFAATLSKITDSRFQLVRGNVIELSQHLRDYAPNGVDAIVSGIPFSFHSEEELNTLFKNTYEGLSKGGRFIVYQVSPLWKRYFEKYFGNVELDFEPRNIPPYFILTGTK